MDFDLILKQLSFLRKNDTALIAFGSSVHKYELNPTLEESDILAFEKKEGVKLPKGYRDYLKNIGNGGAGPSYGLYSLEEARNGAGWHHPIKSLNDKTDDETEHPGELLISHNGCGLFTWLKITGSNGEIWFDGRTNCQEPYCIGDDFLVWYKNWIDGIFMENWFITNLGNEALELGQRGLFKESLDLFKVGVNIACEEYFDVPDEVRSAYLGIFCNVLYFLQNDNTGLPVDKELNNYFLDKCLIHAKDNPAIYFNAACVYNEMKDFDNVLMCIESAKKHYPDYEMMAEAIRTEELFSEFREKYSFY
ncbi:SMI1/KNR4 family protein [Flagellimonas meishanensis]|uniref:SMI1/KNR4 family protein n=1 Tax=Flagellimonas meishanensis TaxID=2873264 RepID=UPI001CA60B4F|nr:SMI1/KNR4 family protein [[Muricauda] meishanensis]